MTMWCYMKLACSLIFAFICFASLQAGAQVRLVERAPTKFVEEGKAVSLEVVMFKPKGSGPFPALMFNHGSTGRGNNPSLFTKTETSSPIYRFFNERGWMVAFPQRRGRGKSDGIYDEGFQLDRSRGYSCDPYRSLLGLEHAMQDLDEAVEYLKGRTDVDSKRMLIGGQSRGGILSIVYAGTRPDIFKGAINFVGGWMSDGCENPGAINTVSFKRGAGFQRPTLWLYGENDVFYSMGHSRTNFNTFIAAGGKGSFYSYSLGSDKNGHGLINRPDLWREKVESFVEQVQ
jgi:dienelactone hydrolase